LLTKTTIYLSRLGYNKYASEARSMATEKVVNELVQAQLIVDNKAKSEAKQNRKVFLDASLLGEGGF
jgi:hypothetical protein